MNNFSYTQAATTKEATGRHKDTPLAAYLAGGTTLLDLMKANLDEHPQLIDINPLPLSSIEQTKDGLRIGALARMSDVGEHPLVVQGYPAVSQSLLLAASPQLRNMASIGGNMLQRTRCGYFRDAAFPCNKRVPGSGCPALVGDNHNLAILGVSESCIATAYPGDLAVALAAFDAVLEPGELIVAVTIPAAAHAQRSAYLKVRERSSYAYALASAAVGLEVQASTIRAARVALGGVGAQPWRSREAEKVLTGQPATEATFRAAATAALKGAQPRKDNAYKVELAQNTLVRALQQVAG
ncbi:FAD binding domain-containing protein [Hymenobacter sp. BRD128]|uniref:FAD binding domain-containing protein n=1 Tax=Hymenobacter sp. BRD128 TaxID=2675878 RepID=UPI00156692DC|nr:FAD binding domain-containing protein [Hymenobacter sp. BRD128]QKG55850.1 FAD binding domain-containing protein [Hymenobacter sp. BRD128]